MSDNYSAIVKQIRSADNLPSLPTVAVQVLRMTQADEVSVGELARVIQNDPALTSKLLKIVNSSLFGMSRKISSLQQAMVVLGLRTVKVMVLGFSLVDTMKDRKSSGFDFIAYWRRSLTTAVTSRLLAERTRRGNQDEAFIMGLLCDLGMLASFHCARALYEPVLARQAVANEPFQLVEQEILGITHEVIGSELMTEWGLPESLCRAIRTHHALLDAPTHEDPTEAWLIRLIRAASTIADLFCSDVKAGQLETVTRSVVQLLPIEERVLQEVLDALDKHVKEAASLFALNIGPTRRYQDIQAEAVLQLAKLSMAAELERAQIAHREEAVLRQVEELHTENNRLAQEASTDGLTGVANRASLERRLEQECRTTIEQKSSLGMLMLDLDRFKRLNDTFGHQAGDEALRLVGSCLVKLANETRFAARYGGEEFAIVIRGMTGAQVREMAENVRISVQGLRVQHAGKSIPLTVSIGAVNIAWDDPALQPKQIVERADHCLYNAKNAGRNRVIFEDVNALAGAARG